MSAVRLARLDRRISNARLVVFVATVAVAWSGYDTGWWPACWAGVPLGAFVALVVRHDQVSRARQRADRTVRFYDAGVARLEDRWSGGGSDGERYLDAHHPYAADLDLFGHGSL